MKRFLVIGLLLFALLSPVGAQFVAEPPDLRFHVNEGLTQAIVSWGAVPGVTNYLYDIRPAPRCDAGPTLVPAAGDLWSRIGTFNPTIPYTVTVTSIVDNVVHGSATVTFTPPQTLPNIMTPDFQAPLSLSWGETALMLNGALIQPGSYLADRGTAGVAETPPRDTSTPSLAEIVSKQRDLDPVDLRRSYGSTIAYGKGLLDNSAVPAYGPAPSTDARAGIDKLWGCASGGGSPQPSTDTTSAITTTTQSTGITSTSISISFSGTVGDLATNLGGLGNIYRASHSSGPALVVYRSVSSSQGELVLWVTQQEVDAAGTGCVKKSADNRIAARRQGNGNVVIAMGPDGENKTFHVIFNGSVSGGVGGTSTTYDGAPGATC